MVKFSVCLDILKGKTYKPQYESIINSLLEYFPPLNSEESLKRLKEFFGG